MEAGLYLNGTTEGIVLGVFLMLIVLAVEVSRLWDRR